MEQRFGKRKKNKIGYGIFLLFLAIFLVSAVQLIRIVWNYYAADTEYEKMQEYVRVSDLDVGNTIRDKDTAKSENLEAAEENASVFIDFKSLRRKNPDCIAWIYIPGTDISYPVMQGEDNEYYLKHTFSGKELTSASIFMDYGNEADFTDKNTFIYGHNMKDGTMFGMLGQYEDEAFYQKHPGFYIYTPTGSYYYKICSCYRADIQKQTDAFRLSFSSEEEYLEYQKNVVRYSLYDTGVVPTEDQRMVTLSTCHRAGYDYRFLVHAVQVIHH